MRLQRCRTNGDICRRVAVLANVYDGANMLAQLVASDEIIAALTNASPDVNHTFYTNGTINPNTSSTNVLMAAFAGLTKLEVPNPQSGISSETISSDEARILAESMMRFCTSKSIRQPTWTSGWLPRLLQTFCCIATT